MLKLSRFLRPYAGMAVGVLVFVFLQTLGDLYLPNLMARIINDGVMQGDLGRIMQIGGFMLLVAGGGVICSILAGFLASKTAVGFGTILRDEAFRKVMNHSLYEFERFGTATLITRTTNDINQIQMVTIMILRMMLSAPMMAIGGLILAFQACRELTWVLAVAMPLLAGVVVLIASKLMPLFRLVQVRIDRINLVLREKLTGMRVIRAFNTSGYEQRRFEEANVALTDNYIRVNRIMAFMMPTIMLIMNLTSLAVLWFGGFLISTGNMDLGALAAFIQYVMMILMSTLMLAMMFIMVPRAQAAAVRINEVLDTVSEITKVPETKETTGGGGCLEFKEVTFAYPGSEKPVLKNISFIARPGEVTAIIGGTGAGKSTLMNLIPRFYDVGSGSILLDGLDIREIPLEGIRAKIGMVPQKAVLFTGTIAENISFGNEQASEEEIRHAAAIAQATGFIESNEGGFEHQIAQGGTNLSGGQKQRLTIARALARKAAIYIFDDCFSALDFKTDARLRAALREEIAQSTVFIVAQRVGTIMQADRIIVLDEGEIAGMGTHREMLAACDVYSEIVFSQLSEEESA